MQMSLKSLACLFYMIFLHSAQHCGPCIAKYTFPIVFACVRFQSAIKNASTWRTLNRDRSDFDCVGAQQALQKKHTQVQQWLTDPSFTHKPKVTLTQQTRGRPLIFWERRKTNSDLWCCSVGSSICHSQHGSWKRVVFQSTRKDKRTIFLCVGFVLFFSLHHI